MHVTHFRFLLVESHVQCGVVNVILESLVEPDHHVDQRTVVRRGEILREGAGSDGKLLDAALDEIPRRRRLGKHDEIGLRIELRGLLNDRADPGDVL